MHLRHSDHDHGPKTVKIKYLVENPEGMIDEDHFTGTDPNAKEHEFMAAKGEHLLEVAVENGLNIEHACGAVCACSTCHVYIEKGMECLSEAEEEEEDRVEEAPGLQINSRLSCQCIIQKEGEIVVRVPAWNRNAVKEVPH
ncbi:MAG: 2Fe-2S iron-sulfur cluster binding domain-containing protein [Phycisphaerales bacterium]|nr:2Fe-2S iron-sulfur cluster binding domain-containing protein [Phycisphaerales bacterium]